MKIDTQSAGQLPYLETFARAAELGNFTGAARSLRLTQAAISQRVGILEKSLGVSLFGRRGGRVQLTEAGRRLHAYAQRILALHQEARLEVAGQKTPVAGELSLAASSIPGEHLLPALLAGFKRRYPHILVRATIADSLAVLKQVEHGQAQLGFVGRKDDNPHLEFRSFACDKMKLIVPARHPLGRRKCISLQQLLQQPLILREEGSGSRWCLERALEHAGKSLRDLSVVLELGSNEAIKEAVARGLGVAVLSTHAVRKELKKKELHALPVTDLPLKRDIYLVWNRRGVLPIPAQVFLHFLEICPHAGHSS